MHSRTGQNQHSPETLRLFWVRSGLEMFAVTSDQIIAHSFLWTGLLKLLRIKCILHREARFLDILTKQKNPYNCFKP